MMSLLCVAIFWVVNASSFKNSCSRFSIPTWSGLGGREVFHIILMNASVTGRQWNIKRAQYVQLKQPRQMIEKIHRIFMEDRRIEVRKIAGIVGISVGACIIF